MDKNLSFPNPGALPSKYDYRANIVSIAAASATPTPTLPPALFTNFQKLGIYNQSQTPACVSHAMAQLIKLWWYVKTGQIVNFSPRFLHVLSRGSYGPDDGRDPVTVAKIAMQFGCATEATCPNDTSLSNADYLSLPITQAMLDEAVKYKIPGYVQVPVTQFGFREAIRKYGAISILLGIGKEFWTKKDGTPSWAQADIDPVRPPNPQTSGHEVVGSGWNTSLDHFVNSWSADWAQHGESDYLWNEWYRFIVEAIAIAEIPGSALQLVQGLPPAGEFKHAFATSIGYGDSGTEVRALQIALSINGENLYPEITGYYGELTRQAVLNFQMKYQVAPTAELQQLNGRSVGPRTRIKLNELFTP